MIIPSSRGDVALRFVRMCAGGVTLGRQVLLAVWFVSRSVRSPKAAQATNPLMDRAPIVVRACWASIHQNRLVERGDCLSRLPHRTVRPQPNALAQQCANHAPNFPSRRHRRWRGQGIDSRECLLWRGGGLSCLSHRSVRSRLDALPQPSQTIHRLIVVSPS